MERIITIGTKEIPMKATAGTPRRYRTMFHRDLMVDMAKLSEKMKKNKESGSEFDNFELTMFENVAYIMALQADTGIKKNVEAWLDDFEMFDIYEVLPQILEMWNIEIETQLESKKNLMVAVAK